MEKYTIINEIAKGCFGEVVQAKHNKTGELVAIKMEERSEYNILKHEVEILHWLFQKRSRKIPPVYWFGIHETYNCLIMPFYEYSLKDYVIHKGLTTKTANKIMITLLDIMQDIHTKWVIHRDIKPENFMIKNGEIFIIDFGLATFFTDDGKTHCENTRTDSLIGTPKYTSIHIHMGNTYSRRDDMIAVGYMMMDLEYIDIPLPWSDCQTGILDGAAEGRSEVVDTSAPVPPIADLNYPDIHILHPLNIYRQFLKSIENIQHWLKSYADTDADADATNRIERWMNYYCMTYAMTYPEKPKYDELMEFFDNHSEN